MDQVSEDESDSNDAAAAFRQAMMKRKLEQARSNSQITPTHKKLAGSLSWKAPKPTPKPAPKPPSKSTPKSAPKPVAKRPSGGGESDDAFNSHSDPSDDDDDEEESEEETSSEDDDDESSSGETSSNDDDDEDEEEDDDNKKNHTTRQSDNGVEADTEDSDSDETSDAATPDKDVKLNKNQQGMILDVFKRVEESVGDDISCSDSSKLTEAVKRAVDSCKSGDSTGMTASIHSVVAILAGALQKSVKKQTEEKKNTKDMRVAAAELARPMLDKSQATIELVEDLKHEYDQRVAINFDELRSVVERLWTSQCALLQRLAATADGSR
jgi:hypothetical protein